ncbi:MFS transporter [Mycolicibacillus koreensis]|nr:MFS transporter [Mycolicibacillus koreensis]
MAAPDSHPATRAADPGSPGAGRPPRAGPTIGILVLAAFTMFLNETVLAVALKTLSESLALPISTVQWVTSVFLLTMAVVVPVTGYLLERFDERQVFFASTGLFSTGTLVCALAPGIEILIGGRVLQAGGTALIMPLLMTTIMRSIAPERRGTVLGTVTIVVAVAPALGPTAGGFVLGSLNWRWLFWIVLPILVTVILVGVVALRPAHQGARCALDVPSIPLVAVGFGGLVYGLTAIGESTGGLDVVAVAALSIGCVAITGFVARQLRLQRRDRALLDLRVFTHRRFRVGAGIVGLLFVCMMALSAVLLPIYLQTVLGQTPMATGLVLLPGGLALGVLGPVVGRVYDRIGARGLVLAGTAAATAAVGMLALLGVGSPLWCVVVANLALMIGISLVMTPLNTDALSALPKHLYSHGAATLTTVQQMAGTIGIAVFVTIATRASGSVAAAPDAAGLHRAFAAMVWCPLAALALAFLVRGPRPGPLDAEGR